MPYFQYNKEAQNKFSVGGGEPFLKGIGQNKMFVLKEGTYQIRLLPPWSREGLFAKFMKIHWQVGLSRSTFVCPTMFGAESCPFCEVYSQLVSEYERYSPDVNACRPARRYYSNIISMSSPGLGVLVYSYGQKVYGAFKGLQDSGDYGDITDPTTGCNITLTRQGSGRNVQDQVLPARNASPLQNADWLDDLFDLDNIFIEPDPQDVKAAFATQPWKVWEGSGKTSTKVAPIQKASPPETSPPAQTATPVSAVAAEQKPVTDLEEGKAEAPVTVAEKQETAGTVDAIKSLENKLRSKLQK